MSTLEVQQPPQQQEDQLKTPQVPVVAASQDLTPPLANGHPEKPHVDLPSPQKEVEPEPIVAIPAVTQPASVGETQSADQPQQEEEVIPAQPPIGQSEPSQLKEEEEKEPPAQEPEMAPPEASVNETSSSTLVSDTEDDAQSSPPKESLPALSTLALETLAKASSVSHVSPPQQAQEMVATLGEGDTVTTPVVQTPSEQKVVMEGLPESALVTEPSEIQPQPDSQVIPQEEANKAPPSPEPPTPGSSETCEEEDYSGMPPLEDIVKKPEASKEAHPPQPFKMEETPRMTDEDGWLDLTGNGGLKKKVIETGRGYDTRPHNGDIMTITYQMCDLDGNIVEQEENQEIILGDWDVLPGLDMALALMEDQEKAEIIVPERFAYMKEHMSLETFPEADKPDFKMTLQIKHIERQSAESFASIERRMQFLEYKKKRASMWFRKKYYSLALLCYEKILNFLDRIMALDQNEPSGVLTEQFTKEAETCRTVILNNKAACQLKLELWQPCLKSLEEVLYKEPNNVKAIFRKAKALEGQGDLEEAISLLKTIADSNKESRDTLQYLLARKKKQVEEEKKMYQRMFNSSQDNKDKKQPSPGKSRQSWWSAVVGGIAAVAISLVLYRQLNGGSAH